MKCPQCQGNLDIKEDQMGKFTTCPYCGTKFLLEEEKPNINNGFVYGGEFGRLLGRTPCKWWQLAGASYKYTVEEISVLIRDYIIPIFNDFEDIEKY